jgi:carbamoyl-phosphate synthase small subunit
VGVDLVKEVTSGKKYVFNAGSSANKLKVVVLDCGVKHNILRSLAALGCEVVVLPAETSADEILRENADGLLLSNGPGDPAAVDYVVRTVASLIGKLPIFGICLGHQMIGFALGGKTYKLKFGHHGANHPAKDTKTGTICITSQNHGFCVDIGSLKNKDIQLTHMNLNDSTLEGLRHKKLPLFSVQFHPEASPGPHDAKYLFGEFIKVMQQHKKTTSKKMCAQPKTRKLKTRN